MIRRFLCMLTVLVTIPFPVAAGESPKAVVILNLEERWLTAIATGDAKTLGTILAANFVHINYRGKLTHHSDALEAAKMRKRYVEHTSEQTVDFAGATAIVHGINTVTQAGKVVLRLRYTDVFVLRSGTWLALSAQETTLL
jgi:hypothetical protein